MKSLFFIYSAIGRGSNGRICQLSRIQGPQVLKISCAIASLLAVSACSRGAPPVDFSDPLTGPVSAALSIPFEKYALTAGGLLRTTSESGTENGIERPVVRTISGRYLSRDFVFEVDVTIPADHGDIAFVGFGAGRNNQVQDNEPSHSFLFRIHNLPKMPFYGIDLAIGDPQGGTGYRGAFREFRRIGEYTPGRPMRFRISHQGGNVTLSVPALADAHATFALAKYPGLFDNANAFLFVSNSSQGTTFQNASVRER